MQRKKYRGKDKKMKYELKCSNNVALLVFEDKLTVKESAITDFNFKVSTKTYDITYDDILSFEVSDDTEFYTEFILTYKSVVKEIPKTVKKVFQIYNNSFQPTAEAGAFIKAKVC